MLVMTDILISALKFYPVRMTQSGFPHYVITYLVILIAVGLVRQGIVEAGGVYVSVNCWGWRRFQSKWLLSNFSVVSLVLSVIGGISDPTVPVPSVFEIFWAKFKLNI